MKKLFHTHTTLSLFVIIGFLAILLSFAYKRIDMTSDKRYTLTPATEKILSKITKPIEVDVYLDGDFPADFKQLQSETLSLLDEFQRKNSNISYKLIDPIKENISQDTLQAMGLQPSSLTVEKDGVSKQILLFPYATVKYNGYGQSVPLIIQRAGISSEEQMTASIESLEYNFINAIDKLSRKHMKTVGILTNQKELNRAEMYSLTQSIIQDYNFGPYFPKDKQSLKAEDLPYLKKYDALLIAKPRKAFTDEEKMVVDQYIMNGGKTLWAIDAVNAEMDTLLKSDKILAYPYDLNLTDLLFSYGVRINPAVVKDAQYAAPINLQVGSIQGNAQNKRVPWVYFPLGFPPNKNNIITKNINPVRFEFPSPIDTVESSGVKKTILYQTSPYTDILRTPSYISLDEAKEISQDSVLANYNKGPKILSLLLEGRFTSAYADRIESQGAKNFIRKSKPNKMIIISDGDVARNQIIKGEPVPLGLDPSTGITYGNSDFLINALDYLLDDDGLMSLRNRNVEMRMLDKQEIMMEKSYWQWFNTLVPLAFIFTIGLGINLWRRKDSFQHLKSKILR